MQQRQQPTNTQMCQIDNTIPNIGCIHPTFLHKTNSIFYNHHNAAQLSISTVILLHASISTAAGSASSLIVDHSDIIWTISLFLLPLWWHQRITHHFRTSDTSWAIQKSSNCPLALSPWKCTRWWCFSGSVSKPQTKCYMNKWLSLLMNWFCHKPCMTLSKLEGQSWHAHQIAAVEYPWY